jgi:hypothetical protein
MLKLKSWLSSLLVLAITAVPVMAGSNDAKTTNENAANATSAEGSPAAASPSLASTTGGDANITALLGVLVSKGVLNAEEAKSLSGTPAQQGARLLEFLRQKGILSAADYAALTAPSASAQVAPNLVASTTPILPSVLATNPAPEPQPAKPAPPKVIPAVAPVRVLAVDPPKREGLIPDIKIGAVRVKPYGFYKTSAVYDSSSPLGNDFPLPQFIAVAPAGGDTGPDGNPAFHIKARALRLGTNFEWVDPSTRLTLTGKLEFDFEGNFSRTNNRNVSSIRSNAPSLRLGWTRLDYAASDKDTVFALFGQDWTPFGSSTLPASIETTGLGIAFGSLYERAPMIKGGFVHNFGGSRTFKLSPEIAVVLPAFGNLPADVTTTSCTIPATFVPGTATPITCTSTVVDGLGNQLGFGERQGTDSARPEVEARLVGQFQLDPAPGVAPAQLIVSGVQARRDATVLKSAVPLCTGDACGTIIVDGEPVVNKNKFRDAFPTGFKASSERYGITAEAQLPTRYFTITAKAYRGADLRFFFAGQLFSTFNDTHGLTNTASGLSVDASSTVVFGLDASGNAVAAPQRPVRTYGGFAELGLPLSRIFQANPAGRGAGWSMNLHWGYDAVQASDERRLAAAAAQRSRSDWYFGNLQYKLNQYVTFAFEQGLYRTIATPNQETGAFPLFAGKPSREANDRRSEFATIFTF